VSVFETTIRVLGGLNAAHDLSGDKAFLDKAVDLADRLYNAFKTPSGIPYNTVNLQTGHAQNPSWSGGSSVLSEFGTLQVEFRYVSHASKNNKYALVAEKAVTITEGTDVDGLYGIYYSVSSGKPTNNKVTFGALGDSFYEYLLKVWLQGGRNEDVYHRMYEKSMNAMTTKLIQKSRPNSLSFVADWTGRYVRIIK
jgi:mannosyl-oligosaccharide alpha-1,2-mannosidase